MIKRKCLIKKIISNLINLFSKPAIENPTNIDKAVIIKNEFTNANLLSLKEKIKKAKKLRSKIKIYGEKYNTELLLAEKEMKLNNFVKADSLIDNYITNANNKINELAHKVNLLQIEARKIQANRPSQEKEQKKKELLLKKTLLGSAKKGGDRTLYYLSIPFKGKKYYKIGITDSNVKQRYARVKQKYVILLEQKYINAKELEQQIIKLYEKDLFPLNLLDGGHTEIFDRDVLGLDG